MLLSGVKTRLANCNFKVSLFMFIEKSLNFSSRSTNAVITNICGSDVKIIPSTQTGDCSVRADGDQRLKENTLNSFTQSPLFYIEIFVDEI